MAIMALRQHFDEQTTFTIRARLSVAPTNHEGELRNGCINGCPRERLNGMAVLAARKNKRQLVVTSGEQLLEMNTKDHRNRIAGVRYQTGRVNVNHGRTAMSGTQWVTE